MRRILHAADLHLDAPFSALSAGQAAARRAEQRTLLDRLADTARDRAADLVLLSGDLLDGGETRYETIQALARTLGRMAVPVFLAPGNHDWFHPRSPYAAPIWPDNVHIFRTEAMSAVPLPELGCVVHGAAFVRPEPVRPHLPRPRGGKRTALSGPGPCPYLHRPVPGGGDLVGLSRLSGGPGL